MRNASKGTTKAFYIARALRSMEIGEPHSRHCLFVSSTHQTVNGADFQLSTRRNYAPNYSTYWSHAQKPTLFWWVEKRVEEECAVAGGCETHIFPSVAWLCVSVCLPEQIRVGEFRQLNGTELKTRRCLRNTVFVHVPMVLECQSPRNVYGHVTLVYVLVWFCMCVCSYPCVYVIVFVRVIVFVTMFMCARHCISSPPRWYVCVRSSQWEAYYP